MQFKYNYSDGCFRGVYVVHCAVGKGGVVMVVVMAAPRKTSSTKVVVRGIELSAPATSRRQQKTRVAGVGPSETDGFRGESLPRVNPETLRTTVEHAVL